MNKGYGHLKVDLNSSTLIRNKLVNEIGFYNYIQPIDLHCTIMYDKSNPAIEPINPITTPIKANITGCELLGKEGSQWAACALTFESEEIRERFKELQDMGFKHSYDDLCLHVSIIYGEERHKVFDGINQLIAEGKFPKTMTLTNESWGVIKD